MIQKSIFGELLDIGRDITNLGSDTFDELIDNKPTSIARQAKSGIIGFTTVSTSSVSIEEASMANKAIERQDVAFLSITFSQNSMTDAKSIQEYLKRIQATNLVESAPTFSPSYKLRHIAKQLQENEKLMDAAVETMQNELSESVDFKIGNYTKVNYSDISNRTAKCTIDSIINSKCARGASAYNTPYSNNIIIKNTDNSMSQLTLLQDDENEEDITVMESKICDVKSSPEKDKTIEENKMKNNLHEATKPYVSDYRLDTLNERCTNFNDIKILGDDTLANQFKPSYLSEADEPEKEENNKEKIEKANLRFANARADEAEAKLKSTKEKEEAGVDYQTVNRGEVVCKDILRDSDVKKPNELTPSLMHIKVFFKDAKTGTVTPLDFMVGVKSVLHVLRTDLMTEYIPKSLKNDNKLLRFIKLTSGEISFVKDFIFGLDKTKEVIKNRVMGNRFANTLFNRKKSARAMKVLFKQNLAVNSTFILSMDEVEKMRVDNKLDLMNPVVAKKVMESLYLLGLVILDSSVEIGYFMFDGDNDYQTHSYRSLERENANSEKDMKNILKLAGKM